MWAFTRQGGQLKNWVALWDVYALLLGQVPKWMEVSGVAL